MSTPLRHYEVMVILDPTLEERTIQPSLDAFLNVVKTAGVRDQQARRGHLRGHRPARPALCRARTRPAAQPQRVGAADQGPPPRPAVVAVMAGETVITVVGNLTADPELRFTPSGAAVASFTIASTPRTFDRTSNEWKDGEALFLRCSIWRQAAENVAESLTRGMRVVATGRLKQRSFETREGAARRAADSAHPEATRRPSPKIRGALLLPPAGSPKNRPSSRSR